jgi:iron complex outermembrane recepter protein
VKVKNINRQKPTIAVLSWVVSCGAGLVAYTLANAQSTSGSQPAPGALEEIIVTAEKRTENLQQTPLAVTALSGQTLEQFNIQTTQDLMQIAPGLTVATQTAGDSGGSATFYLRGLGQERSGNGSEPAVGIYIDDFYYPSIEGSIFTILDMQQIEVLRGPQGTLFGRDTIGGAIRYTTAKPTDKFEGFLNATVGSYGRNDFTGVLNVPLNEIIDMRVTLGRLQTSGYVRQQDGGVPAGGTETQLARVQVRIKPTSNLTVDLVAQQSEDYLDGFPYTQPGPIVPIPGTLPFIWNHIPPLGGVNPYDNRYVSQCVYCQAGTNPREFSETRYTIANATVTWDINNQLTLKSLTSWIKVNTRLATDIDGTVLPIFDALNSEGNRAASQEFQLNGNSFNNALHWVTGLYYYDQRVVGSGVQTFLGRSPPGQPEIRNTQTLAAYLDGSYSFTDQFSVFAGARHSEDRKNISVYDAGPGVLFSSDDASFVSNTGRFGVKFQWTPDIMTYASVSEGFRAGGFNNNSGVLSTFQPEKDTSYEIGARTDFWDHRVRINPTIFYTKYKDIQVQSVEVVPAGPIIILQNAARAHTYGFELEAQLGIMQNLRLLANLATLDAKYDSVGTATDVTVNTLFAHAPHIAYSVGLQHTAHLPYGSLNSTLNWSWQDTQGSTPEQLGQIVLPSYGLLGARVEFATPDEHWKIAVSGTNLTNKVSYLGGVDYTVNAGTEHLDLGRPREWGASLKYQF